MIASDRLANRHFLVVDDEEFVRVLVTRFLNRSGAAGVVAVADGREAIDAILNYEMAFDAVITDINMRPMNGIDLLRAVRMGTEGLKRNMAVIVLTAHSEAALVAEALALDANAFVVKPVEREVLVERIMRVLEHTQPIQPAAWYGAIGDSAAMDALAANMLQLEALEAEPFAQAGTTLDAAPPTKPLLVSIASALRPALAQRAARLPTIHGSLESRSPVAEARRIALEDIEANSILAQDIYIVDTPRLLLAAPVILTRAMLDRLKDLGQIHDCYSHMFVITPAA
jgi:DNA-binding NarL/FixJ family response regulator